MTLFGYTLDFNTRRSAHTNRLTVNPLGETLCDVLPGARAMIRGFSPAMSAERWAHLQSYGLTPGRWVRVVQHAPVTVIQVEHCELALEDDLARLIEVSAQ